ncbi:MAG TPA: peptidylprolyl isomerase [Anaerolineae bacterium]|nr:peptidylprolyl isomerase [Anaerolineae bacterium]
MAKRKVKKDVSLTRKQASRRQKERRQRLIIIAIAAGIGSLILAILGYGAYQELVAKPAEPVATVNGLPLSTHTYQQRVLLERMSVDANIENMQAQRSLYDPETDAFIISIIDQQLSQLSLQREFLDNELFLDELIDEELIRQAAQEAGIEVSPEEVDRRLEELFGYNLEEPTAVPATPTATITSTTELTPTVTPTPFTRERFEELYNNYLTTLKEGADLSEAEYTKLVELQILREKMEEFVGQQVPTSELQIHARHILLDTEEQAQAALERLQEGEDFSVVATEVSTDTLTAEQGGDLGWLPQGEMDEAFDEVAFDLPVGEISDIVETPSGFHIILVEERDENRELDPETLEQRKSDAFDQWLEDLRAGAAIEKYWSADKVPPE